MLHCVVFSLQVVETVRLTVDTEKLNRNRELFCVARREMGKKKALFSLYG